MNNTIIKQIPTNLNYCYKLNKTITKIIKNVNLSRLLILFLILWNLTLTTYLFIPTIKNKLNPFPQFTQIENEQIMALEQIPFEQLIENEE